MHMCPTCYQSISKTKRKGATAAAFSEGATGTRLLLIACKEVGAAPDVMRGAPGKRSYNKHVLRQRAAVVLLLRSIGMSWPKIGELFNVHYTSAMNWIR